MTDKAGLHLCVIQTGFANVDKAGLVPTRTLDEMDVGTAPALSVTDDSLSNQR